MTNLRWYWVAGVLGALLSIAIFGGMNLWIPPHPSPEVMDRRHFGSVFMAVSGMVVCLGAAYITHREEAS